MQKKPVKRNKQRTKNIKNTSDLKHTKKGNDKNEMKKRYKRLPCPWKMKRRKSNKNEKMALYNIVYIVKINRHCHFKFQKHASFLQISNGVFGQKYFPIRHLFSCPKW